MFGMVSKEIILVVRLQFSKNQYYLTKRKRIQWIKRRSKLMINLQKSRSILRADAEIKKERKRLMRNNKLKFRRILRKLISNNNLVTWRTRWRIFLENSGRLCQKLQIWSKHQERREIKNIRDTRQFQTPYSNRRVLMPKAVNLRRLLIRTKKVKSQFSLSKATNHRSQLMASNQVLKTSPILVKQEARSFPFILIKPNRRAAKALSIRRATWPI